MMTWNDFSFLQFTQQKGMFCINDVYVIYSMLQVQDFHPGLNFLWFVEVVSPQSGYTAKTKLLF